MSRHWHWHRCGFSDEGGALGCGHVFEHEKPPPGRLTRAEIRERHFCPKCGLGPWLFKYDPDFPMPKRFRTRTAADETEAA